MCIIDYLHTPNSRGLKDGSISRCQAERLDGEGRYLCLTVDFMSLVHNSLILRSIREEDDGDSWG